MLRHAQFYMKGGLRTFAAVCMEVCFELPFAAVAQMSGSVDSSTNGRF
jgi:hypothetical protein